MQLTILKVIVTREEEEEEERKESMKSLCGSNLKLNLKRVTINQFEQLR